MKKIVLAITLFFCTHPIRGVSIDVYFSPQDKVHSKLIQAIDATQKKIYAAIYMFTDKTIVDALVRAKQERGVNVQIITDKISLESSFGKAQSLAQQGITVFTYQPNENSYNQFFNSYPIMHHKFALFDTTVWTGSFNWTRSADVRNKENVVVIKSNPKTYQRYLQQFESLKKECKLCIPSYATKTIHNDPLCLLKTFYYKLQQTERLLKQLRN